jgi:hypothetical protein
VVCYFLAGMQSTQAIASRTTQRHSGDHATSKNAGTTNKQDNRLYWTSHKHKPEHNRSGLESVAVSSNVPSKHTDRIESGSTTTLQPILSALVTDLRTGRAPPLSAPHLQHFY